ncbi:hypothetical protein BDV95DRAFT_594699 [Massariosphaeria phaeospora]|uniref:RING-type domain-containing protein n=1 Tax=Massariosphaeria phaeospora TaxID=100035 RepID=A0A7C8I5W8_9PLEO|nr:hypothetical protein BDV95DRAFT_594699 [Massariosphaeria phaeospora]
MASAPPTVDANEAFIQAHTTVLFLSDNGGGSLDECPICLDNFTTENAVQISGVNGCSHVIGYNCLRNLLASNASAEKKCPLCRAVWIPAPVTNLPGNPQPAASRNSRGRPGLSAAPHRAGATREAIRPQMWNGQGPPNNMVQAQPVINLASDSEEEVTVESFAEFNRDISNIRERAGRNQRAKADHRRSSARAREELDAQVPRSYPNGQDNGARTRFSGMRPFGAPTPRDLTLADVYSVRPPSLIQRRGRALQELPVPIASPETDEVENVQPPNIVRVQQLDLLQKQHELDEQERRLNERQRILEQKEMRLNAREMAVAIREQRATTFTTMLMRECAEAAQLARQHETNMRNI